MSQNVFPNIDPDVTTGLMLAALLDDFKAAVVSGLSGVSRPAALQAGGLWVDTSNQDAPNYSWSLKLFNGSTDLEIIKINVVSGESGFNFSDGQFTVRKVSADALGSVINLMKSRIANGGQVLTDDVVARINFVGRTDTSTDPVVAYFKAVSTDDMTSSSQGAVFSMYSTPVGGSAIAEHLKFLAGTIESATPHKFNSLVYGQDTVSSSTDMLISDDKMVTEITGGTSGDIHGIEVSGGGTKYKVLLNSGSGKLTLKNNSAGTANDYEKLSTPGGKDYVMGPGDSAWFIYTGDSRWTVLGGRISPPKDVYAELISTDTEWTSPASANALIAGFSSGVYTSSKRTNVWIGETYRVKIGSGNCYFGPHFMGSNLDKITITYLGA